MAPSTGAAVTASDRRCWIVLLVLCTGQLMIVLDSTVVNVALPVVQRDLHFSQSFVAWVINAYLLTFGGLLLLAGRLGDLIGRTRVFLVGLAVFTLSSLACGLATTPDALVSARFVQGASAAMVSSMVLGIISPMFPEPRLRTRAFSIYAFVAVGGVSLGLILGGVVTEVLSWHWIFFLNVPLGAVTLLLGGRLLTNEPSLGIRAGADFLGALFVTSAPILAVYGLIDAGSSGWGSMSCILPISGAVVLGAGFVGIESHIRTPLIPLHVFRHRNLTGSSVVRILYTVGYFAGLNVLGALYLERVLGYSPLQTGLAFLPSSLMIGAIGLVLIPRLVQRISLKALVIAGLALITAGLLVMSQATVHSQYTAVILPAMLLVGMGVGVFFTPSVSIAMSDLPASEAGVASGLTNVAVQLGASLGVAILAALSTSRTKHLLAEHATAASALSGGYHTGFVVAAGATASSLIAAVVLLRTQQGDPTREGRSKNLSWPRGQA